MKVKLREEKNIGLWSRLAASFALLRHKGDRLVFPPGIKCLICGRDLPQVQEEEFCSECLEKLSKISDTKCCKICGNAMPYPDQVCINCKTHKREFDQARIVFLYENAVRNLIYGLKFRNQPYISRTLGFLLAKKFETLSWEVDVAIPVPLSKKRQRWRGYNQSELLAREFVSHTKIELCVDNLIKVVDTKQQARLGFKERQENLQRSFKVRDSRFFEGKRVLLIDDVLTSGATANACATVLKRAGAAQVLVLCVACTKLKVLAVKKE